MWVDEGSESPAVLKDWEELGTVCVNLFGLHQWPNARAVGSVSHRVLDLEEMSDPSRDISRKFHAVALLLT